MILLFFILPVGVENLPDRYDVAFIEFDEHDHVKRSGLATKIGSFSYDEGEAKKWLATKEKSKH